MFTLLAAAAEQHINLITVLAFVLVVVGIVALVRGIVLLGAVALVVGVVLLLQFSTLFA